MIVSNPRIRVHSLVCSRTADSPRPRGPQRSLRPLHSPSAAAAQDANGRLRPGHDRDLCLDTLGQDVAPAGAAVVVTDCFEDPEPSQVFQLAFTCPGGAERSANGTCGEGPRTRSAGRFARLARAGGD